MGKRPCLMPYFTVSEWRGKWWMDRDSPELGFTEQAVGPFPTKLKAAAMARWMNRRNGHRTPPSAGEEPR